MPQIRRSTRTMRLTERAVDFKNSLSQSTEQVSRRSTEQPTRANTLPVPAARPAGPSGQSSQKRSTHAVNELQASPILDSSPRALRSTKQRSAPPTAPQIKSVAVRPQHASRAHSSFPSRLDTIKVQWFVNNETIWWPASVVRIDDTVTSSNRRQAELLYKPIGAYKQELTKVLFTIEAGTSQRMVSTIYKNTASQDVSSWMFMNEHLTTNDDASVPPESTFGDVDTRSIEPTVPVEGDLSPSTANKSQLNYTQQQHQSRHPSHEDSPNTSFHCTRQDTVPKKRASTGTPQKSTRRKTHRDSAGEISAGRNEQFLTHLENKEADATNDCDDNLSTPHAPRSYQTPLTSNGDTTVTSDLLTRIDTLEKTVTLLLNNNSPQDPPSMHMNYAPPIPLPSSTSPHVDAVKLSLKWLLLKKVEKTSKPPASLDLSVRGVAGTVVTVNCDCDYTVFKEIAASLAQKHCPALANGSSSSTKSRIRFHPKYARTQCDSTSVDNLSISFTSLSDVMDFLNVRDERDYEKILCSEVHNSRDTFLQIFGTMEVLPTAANLDTLRTEAGDQSSQLHSATASSSHPSSSSARMETIDISIGSAPHTLVTRDDITAPHPAANVPFQLYIFRQNCRNFSDLQGCYRTVWTCSKKSTHLTINSDEGIQRPADKSKFFVLQWTQVKPPSTKKWSRDTHNVLCPIPGQIVLSLPVVFTASRPNVQSIAELLDDNIDDILIQRVKLKSSNNKLL